MQIGTDTYVTIPEAESYIAAHYISTHPCRLRWDELIDDDKETLLKEACAEIELLQLQGRKAETTQPMAFPRRPFQDVGETGAPDKIKYAQIELALWLSDTAAQADISQRAKLQSMGVESFSLGDLSESYKSGAGEKPAPLLCPKARMYLNPYLTGGYVTC